MMFIFFQMPESRGSATVVIAKPLDRNCREPAKLGSQATILLANRKLVLDKLA
jgi:hypothetical protein